MVKRSREHRTCRVCGQDYETFALESYEMQIPDAEYMCKDCLYLAVDEEYDIDKEYEE